MKRNYKVSGKKLEPKDPVDVFMGGNARSRKREIAAITAVLGDDDQYPHQAVISKLESRLSARALRPFHRQLDRAGDNWTSLEFGPKQLRKLYDALIDCYNIECAMRHDQMMLRNCY